MKECEIPKDADGDAMRRVLAGGSNLSRPMKIDFHIAAPSKQAAKKIGAAAKKCGFEVESYYDRERGGITCSCSRTMILSHSELLRIQKELNTVGAPHGGRTDGWGTYGNKEEANQSSPTSRRG